MMKRIEHTEWPGATPDMNYVLSAYSATEVWEIRPIPHYLPKDLVRFLQVVGTDTGNPRLPLEVVVYAMSYLFDGTEMEGFASAFENALVDLQELGVDPTPDAFVSKLKSMGYVEPEQTS